MEFAINGTWDDAVQDVLAEVEERYSKWQYGKAYLVAFSVAQHWPDTGAAQPYVNVKVNGAAVSTGESNKGVQASDATGTWVDNSAVAINTTNYEIERGESIEIRCTEAGTNGDAECLIVSLVFVYE
jgi:hypothetical protein